MLDVTKFSDIIEGMNVTIKSSLHIGDNYTGIIHAKISSQDNSEGIEAMLTSGRQGNVICINNSIDTIIERIMKTESNNSDNKENFYPLIMQQKSIPLAISSFLNGRGGFLYLGVLDDGDNIDDRLTGLDLEKDIAREQLLKKNKLQPGQLMTDVAFQDEYRSNIEDQLNKFLDSAEPVNSQLEFEFPKINDVMICEITIKRSPVPVFYSFPPRNKHRKFTVMDNGESKASRELDEFHYRQGSSKEQCNTFSEFVRYYKEHFE
jgi:hypothetical protein